MSAMIKVDKEYLDWISDIALRFKQSQIKAANKVNVEMLRFYWSLGKDIFEKDVSNKYGSGFYKRISSDLQSELPDIKSFSVTNLHYMRWFYELYPNAEKLPQLGVDSKEASNLPQAGVNSESLIFSIPWGHNKLIIDKCKGNTDKALFFVKETMISSDHGYDIGIL